ncbi:MAG: hypothetical protein KIS92_18695 [Planctomycetota bacterium]|nr:hypothetical protein [Planctomycetota bacterium]
MWSEPAIQTLCKEFVCVGEEVWNLDHTKGPGQDFFDEYGKGVPGGDWNAGGGNTRQGLWIMGPNAEYLESHFARHGEAETLDMLKNALKRWEKVVAEKGYKPKPVPMKDVSKMWGSEGVDKWAGGTLGAKAAMILLAVSRDLPNADGTYIVGKEYQQYKGMFNQSWAEFTQEDALSFVPKNGPKGNVPDRIVRQLCRVNLIDNVRGQVREWDEGDLKTATLTTEAIENKGGKLTVRLQGEFKMEHGELGFEGKMYGKAILDAATQKFVYFELVASGVRRGSDTFNFRRNEPPTPLGVLFMFEDQYEKPCPVPAAAPIDKPFVPAAAAPPPEKKIDLAPHRAAIQAALQGAGAKKGVTAAVRIFGKVEDVKFVSADASGATVALKGNNFPMRWKDLSDEDHARMAFAACENDVEALYNAGMLAAGLKLTRFYETIYYKLLELDKARAKQLETAAK